MKVSPLRLRARLASPAAALVVAASTGTAVLFGGGTASAGLDNWTVIDTPIGYSMEAQQWDTSFQFYPPLDRNPLTREWFQDGTSAYVIRGNNADGFSGTITLGYQVGYPASPTGSISLSLTQPDTPPATGPNLTPAPGFTASVGYGPGVQNFKVAEGQVKGAGGAFRVHGVHGTVSGVLGMISIRPYVTLTSWNNDSVTTYGPIWNN